VIYQPQVWVFEHFHQARAVFIEVTRFVCVSDDLTSPGRALAIWDTEERKLLLCPADPSAPPARGTS